MAWVWGALGVIGVAIIFLVICAVVFWAFVYFIWVSIYPPERRP